MFIAGKKPIPSTTTTPTNLSTKMTFPSQATKVGDLSKHAKSLKYTTIYAYI